MTITKKKVWTYEDYCKLEDDKRYEVVEGELIEMPSPRRIHQEISMNLSIELGGFVKRNQLGKVYSAPFDVVLTDINTFQPDLLYISNQQLDILEAQGVFGLPDLVIEILSPSNPNHDRVKKFQVYEKVRVQELWIIDPLEETIEIFTLDNQYLNLFWKGSKNDMISSKILPEFKISYHDLV